MNDSDVTEHPKSRPSYTARELEKETGFDRRTIAYYIQEGLLPRVGRRGPRTRYPKLARDRLLFIRRVREAEEAGTVSAVSLSDMRRVFERVSTTLVASVADGRIAITPEVVERAPTAFRLPALRRMALEERLFARGRLEGDPEAPLEPPTGPAEARGAGPPPDPEAPEVTEEVAEGAWAIVREQGYAGLPGEVPSGIELARSLAELQERARRRGTEGSRSLDIWARIEVTPDIVVSVRGLTDGDGELVARVRRAMRRVISGRGGGGRG